MGPSSLLAPMRRLSSKKERADLGQSGVVSAATLDAGGYVQGLLPKALVERASEATPAPGEIKSGEGQGGDLITGEHEGRMSMEVTSGMHAVCSPFPDSRLRRSRRRACRLTTV